MISSEVLMNTHLMEIAEFFWTNIVPAWITIFLNLILTIPALTVVLKIYFFVTLGTEPADEWSKSLLNKIFAEVAPFNSGLVILTSGFSIQIKPLASQLGRRGIWQISQ